MTKSKIFLILSLSFIGGIFLASFYFKIVADYYFLLAITLLLVPLIVFYKNKKIFIAVFVGLFFIFGFWLTGARLNEINATNYNGQKFSGQALIIKEPENNGKYQKIIARLAGESNLKILLNTGLYPEYKYGDEINLKCTLETPENFDEDFDYRMYLAKDGIYYVCSGPKLEIISHGKGNKFYSGIINVKNKFASAIDELIPTPEAGLLSGLLLGGDGKLPQSIQDNFSRTGMTHIVAVSGYNITIIAEYLMLSMLFLGFWRRQAFWFSIVGIFLFILMIGFPSSAVRAGVMGSLLLWAMKNGRLANSQNAIVASAGVMLLINPLLLRWDIGFQLSFLATLGIVYLYPLLEQYLVKKNKVFGLMEILGLTISAQIFVLPVILINFGNLSLISPLANVLVLPIIPLTMLMGFFAAISKLILPPLAAIFSWLVFLPLKYETEVINFLGNISWASVRIEKFGWYIAVIWYILLARIVFILRKNKKVYAEQE
ncbi:MAG: hypothetical protein A2Z52_02645 [Candidatus Moranbacteria bacterium RBG_19FT_COMBO_42_6]|nr:MAG: hypothetical protein A2Z52_02645 [Candidatus Moranbacteria bacterium RBG_19FT_COMBO_42_6]